MSPLPLSEQERFDRLRLARTDRVGAVAFDQLMKRYRSAGRVLDALPELAQRGGARGFRPAPKGDIERELAAGAKLGAKLLLCGEAGFPPLISAMDPPSPVLWTLGDIGLLSKDSVAVVGARIASASGQRFARGLASEVGQGGYVVVSGLARGIDAAAHEGSLPTGTVAVLGGGVDDIYPQENAALYQRIAEGGCVVSESPPGTRAQARDFPRRNRVIAGLSLGVVVVEAEMRSGSLITARLAAEAGREVFAVPGSPLDPRAKGTNDLIRQGASLCEGAEDVLRELSTPRFIREPGASYEGLPDEEPPQDAAADRIRNLVLDLLSPTPVGMDELVRATGASSAEVLGALVELSLAGEAELGPGGMASRG